MKTILMTGAAGRIGTFLRPELAGKYKLRLSDIEPITDLKPGETFVRADISNMAEMLELTKGVDAVVHFGGQSGENDWEHILSAHIVGVYNVLEAARVTGVRRVLVATSNHAVGFYRTWIRSGLWRTATPNEEMFRPYGRLVVLHLTVLLGAFGGLEQSLAGQPLGEGGLQVERQQPEIVVVHTAALGRAGRGSPRDCRRAGGGAGYRAGRQGRVVRRPRRR